MYSFCLQRIRIYIHSVFFAYTTMLSYVCGCLLFCFMLCVCASVEGLFSLVLHTLVASFSAPFSVRWVLWLSGVL